MKNVFITGGNGAIGSGIVNIFKDNGYSVIAPNSTELDLSDPQKINIFLEQIGNSFDIFIHCAGVNKLSTIENIEFDNIYNTMQINTFSFLNIMKHFLPFQKVKGGHVLAISSLYSIISRDSRVAYSMSKHALDGIVKTAAIEFAKYNIIVNSLSPGFIDTPMTRKNNSLDRIKKIEASIPLGNMGNLDDIAKVAYFLCTDNSYITGQNIVVDGGFMCGGFQNG